MYIIVFFLVVFHDISFHLYAKYTVSIIIAGAMASVSKVCEYPIIKGLKTINNKYRIQYNTLNFEFLLYLFKIFFNISAEAKISMQYIKKKPINIPSGVEPNKCLNIYSSIGKEKPLVFHHMDMGKSPSKIRVYQKYWDPSGVTINEN